MEPNAPFGLWPGLQYVGEEVDNIKGRPLFIYTDGLNEAENPRYELFGNDRLIQLMNGVSQLDAEGIIQMLQEEVERHRSGASPNDDLTLLSLTVKKFSA